MDWNKIEINGEIPHSGVEVYPVAVRAWPEHDCYAWNTIHYQCSPEYTAAVCGVCNKIVGFKWRSTWRKFVGLITDEPFLLKHVRYSLTIWRNKIQARWLR